MEKSKLEKYREERARHLEKIADLQKRVRALDQRIMENESMEIRALMRSENVTLEELTALVAQDAAAEPSAGGKYRSGPRRTVVPAARLRGYLPGLEGGKRMRKQRTFIRLMALLLLRRASDGGLFLCGHGGRRGDSGGPGFDRRSGGRHGGPGDGVR